MKQLERDLVADAIFHVVGVGIVCLYRIVSSAASQRCASASGTTADQIPRCLLAENQRATDDVGRGSSASAATRRAITLCLRP